MPFVPDKAISRFVPDAAVTTAPAPTDGYAGRSPFSINGEDVKKTLGMLAEIPKGVVETVASGVTGLGASAANLVNSLGPKELLKNPGESDADFYSRTRNDLTYKPTGEAATALGKVLEPTVGRVVNAAGTGVTNLTGDAAAGELTKDALNVLPAAFGAPDLSPTGIASRATAAAERRAPSMPSVGTADTGNPVAVLRAAGYKLRPSDAAKASPEMGVPGTTREKFSGSSDIRKDFIDPNQRKTTQLAATEVGLPANTPRITPTLLDQQRAPHIATYGEVGQAVGKFDAPPEFSAAIDAVSDQTGLSPVARRKIASDIAQYKASSLNGPDVVKTISALRRRSVAEGKSQDVNTQDLGSAHRQVADILEDQLSQQASAIGQPELAAKLKDARTALAKINDVDSAVKGGQVDAHALNNLVKNGAQLSGNLKIIADAAEYAPHVTRHPQSVADVGAVESPLPLVNPLLDIASGGIRPLVRSYLKSDTFQNKLGPEASKTGVDSPLGEYFHKPEVSAPVPQYDIPPQTSASSMNTANRLAGDLSLAPDTLGNQIVLPPAPPSLHADIPPATPSNGVPFTGSPPIAADALAGNLSLADEFTGNGGMTFNPPNGLEPGLGARQLLATQENSRPINSTAIVPPGAMQLADALGLSTVKNVQDQIIPDEFVMPGSTVVRAGNEKSPSGFLAFGPDQNGGLTISRSTLKPEAQGQGAGKAMLLEAANQAAEMGKPLHSDQSVTVAQLRVYESLKKAGKIEFEYSNPDKVTAALKVGDPRATVKGNGSPVITNIRPVKRSGTG